MRREKQRARRAKSALAVRLGLVCLCGYLAVSLVMVQMEIVTKRQQLENVTQQVYAQQAENQELQRTLESGDESDYMERVARDKLGYALPSERVFVDMSGK